MVYKRVTNAQITPLRCKQGGTNILSIPKLHKVSIILHIYAESASLFA